MSKGYGEDRYVGEWAKQKLQYLASYLPAYLNATKKAPEKYYIDCFAGYGNWFIRDTGEEIKGSPLLALEIKDKFNKYYFIDLDKERVRELRTLISKFPKKNCSLYHDNCNNAIHKIMYNIPKWAPTFVFLDPSGAHIEWSTIELLSKWKTELFINFPLYMDIQRRLTNDPDKINPGDIDQLNTFFGNNNWQKIYDRKFSLDGPRFRIIDLMELYTLNLKELGYEHVLFSDTIKNSKNVPIYYLIWVGKHDVGEKIMKHVLKDQFNPQLRLF